MEICLKASLVGVSGHNSIANTSGINNTNNNSCGAYWLFKICLILIPEIHLFLLSEVSWYYEISAAFYKSKTFDPVSDTLRKTQCSSSNWSAPELWALFCMLAFITLAAVPFQVWNTSRLFSGKLVLDPNFVSNFPVSGLLQCFAVRV